MTRELIKDYTLRISSASRTEIVVILYEVAERYIDDAVNSLHNHEEYRKQCLGAQRVLKDLMDALDYEYELAGYLFSIYEYCISEISSAIIKEDSEMLVRVKGYLTALKEAFVKIAKEDASGPVMGNAQTVYAGLTYGRGRLNESVDAAKGNRGYIV